MYRINNDNVCIKNYYGTIWCYLIGGLYIDLNLTSFGDFIAKFLAWWKKLQIKKTVKSNNFMSLVEDIYKKFINLCYMAKNNNKINTIYHFKSTKDIRIFIVDVLELTTNHGKIAWFIKGQLLAHKDFNQKRLIYDALSRYIFYYTLAYHLWFCRGQIKGKKCLMI